MSSNSTPSGLKKFENGFIRIAGKISGKQGLQLGRLISRSWATWQQSGFEHGLQTVANLIALVSNGILNFFRFASSSNFQLESLNQIL